MLANLRALLGVIIDILLLRRGPDSLPASTALLCIVIAIHLVFASLAAATAPQAVMADQNWPMQLAMGVVVTLLWYRAMLALARKRERFAQTMTAIFATRALVSPALILLTAAVAAQGKNPETASGALAALAMVLMVWLIIVHVRIVRLAFEWSTLGAIGLVLGQEIAAIMLFLLLFGIPHKAS